MLNSSSIHGNSRNLLTESNHFATPPSSTSFLYVIPKANTKFPVARSDVPPSPPPSSAQTAMFTVTEDAANVSNCSHLFQRSCQYLLSPAAEIGPVNQCPRTPTPPPHNLPFPPAINLPVSRPDSSYSHERSRCSSVAQKKRCRKEDY